jgi:FdhD protein
MWNKLEPYEGIRVEPGSTDQVNDFLVPEVRLVIKVNGEIFTATMCSLGNEEDLARGLLYSEDVYRHRNIEPEIIIESRDTSKGLIILDFRFPTTLAGKGYSTSRNLLSVSSCGICGQKELTDPGTGSLSRDFIVDISQINPLFEHMRLQQELFAKTGGSHAAAMFDRNGELLAIREDIGRHNAVDKCIGSLLRRGDLNKVKFLVVSSRVSYEIVAKCFIAGIPVLAAVSAPSSLAVDFCKEFGITLLGFCRNGRFTLYSHPERLNLG